MNIHRSSRAKAKKSTLRRWLAQTMRPSHSSSDSRPLLCERLEHRYALHGMGWFAESTERFDTSEVAFGEDPDSGNRFAQVQTWQATFQTSARPEPEYLDSYVTGEAWAFDATLDDMVNETCDRLHGLKIEGEGPDMTWGGSRGWTGGTGEPSRSLLGAGSVYDQLSTKPQPKIVDWTSPKFELSKSDPVGQHEANTSVNTNVDSYTAVPTHVTVAQIVVPTTGAAAATLVAPRLIDFTTASRGLVAPQNTNAPPSRSSFAPTASVVIRASASPALSNSSAQVSTLVSPNVQLSRTTSSTTSTNALSNADSDASVSIGSSLQNDRLETSADGSTRSARETEGLLSELRSVIEKLASDQAARKALGSPLRSGNAVASRTADELFSSSRQRTLFDDGMLELAATTDQISSSVVLVDGVHQMTSEAQHRSQLIASLELNREFDLAGHSVQALESVTDPVRRAREASLAAEDFENFSDQLNTSAGLSAKPVEAESTIWQRSILPLSFLAIGSLLIRSRKKYMANKSSQ